MSLKLCSVDTGGKEEVLNDGHDFHLAQVSEELVEFVLARAVEDQVGAEDEDACCKNGKDIQAFEAKNSVEKQE